ncbi:hypothetical protein K4T14_08540 [Staphylococcus epidermidis]|uniref:hypothetical protein n=1 Tax=Staphylococcus epidermidis TaxID=1282 RepID=UPI00066C3B91|nr:hypothetical protein [Staphylococcus epidermidis]MDU6040797.1 hypothetical protein [Clostridium butyricum]WEU69980.1 hypothetical protein BE20_0050 [Staphylococcus phage vB_SepS_BE20]MCG1121092.1 hypothetical protein [Staphylococcus epidermidis]MCG1127973.1 hypothetical protein [Staphylococcus epidermidis]MCG1165567.1 hypothetical protein [Staphylococcus epidermidis]
MKVYEYQQLLGFMYREDYKEDPTIAKILIESGWAINRLLDAGTIKPFDDYESVKELIMNETKWRQPDGTYRRT